MKSYVAAVLIAVLSFACSGVSIKAKAQQLDSISKQPDSSQVNSKILGIYAGIGISYGGRVGVLVRPLSNIAIEATAGYAAENFFSPNRLKSIYSLGVNWFLNSNEQSSHNLLNVAFIYAKEYESGPSSATFANHYSICSNYGVIISPQSTFFTIIRAGVQFTNVRYSDGDSKFGVLPNIDVGFGINLF